MESENGHYLKHEHLDVLRLYLSGISKPIKLMDLLVNSGLLKTSGSTEDAVSGNLALNQVDLLEIGDVILKEILDARLVTISSDDGVLKVMPTDAVVADEWKPPTAI